MKPLNFPLIKLILLFLLGVISGFYVQLPFRLVLGVLSICFLIFIGAFLAVKKRFPQPIFFGIITFALMFSLGFFVTKFHSPKNQSEHYINHISTKASNAKKASWIYGKVVEILNPNRYSSRYILELDQLGDQTVTGHVLLSVEKDSTKNTLSIDNRIVLKSYLEPIRKPRNPHQFDYHAFMKNRGVYRQIHTDPQSFFILKNETTSLWGYAENIRNHIVLSLKENGLSHSQLAMVQALLLGQTQDITDEVYADYAAAGVIHILSVSGLHVGFVLLILNYLFRPLERIKYGKPIKIVLMIVLLWGFALLAGFSSPVVRSVTMFSFVAFGLNYGRKTHILNILFISLFSILLFAPNFIFEVGFQLSYLAVFSIVIFQPIFYKICRPKHFIGNILWGTLTVSLAAQIAVVPLSLYYFHQFPGLFFLSNLLVVPYSGFILGFGILVILLALLNLLPEFLAHLFGNCIDLLNLFVAWCANQEAFLFQNLHFSILEMFTSYLFVFCLILLVWKYHYKKLIACFATLIIVLGAFIYEKQQINQTNSFIIFQKNRKSVIGFKRGSHLTLSHNLNTTTIWKEYAVRNFIAGEGIEKTSTEGLKNIYRIESGLLLVVDSLGIYQLPALQNSLVLLRNSPQVNLNRLIELLHPKTIIADGSNYHSYVHLWHKTCEEKQIPFHYTGTNGAFVVEY